MDFLDQDTLFFFHAHPAALPLYAAFEAKLFAAFPQTAKRVQKTQITFSNRYVYACVSFQRVLPAAALPKPYIVVSLGLPYPLDSGRVAVKTEAYPGRWTTHIVIGNEEELDSELFSWLGQAYAFSERK